MSIMNKQLFSLTILLIGMLVSGFKNNTPIRHDSRVKFLIYNKNEVYDLIVHEGYFLIINFSNGERVKHLEFGDPSGWHVDRSRQDVVLLKATTPSVCTSLNITSSKKDYIFEICSKARDDAPENRVYSVNFIYPDLDADKMEDDYLYGEAMKDTGHGQAMNMKRRYVSKNYRISGDSSIAPQEVFNDGEKTYFNFSSHKNVKKLPEVTVMNSKTGKMMTLPRTYKKGHIIVDSMSDKFVLISKDNTKNVSVTRK